MKPGVAVSVLVLVVACSGRGVVDDAMGDGDRGLDIDDRGTTQVAPIETRPRRRMDIDQLNQSFRRVTNGIGWTRGSDGNGADELERLALTLGRPDYVEVTTEDLEPSPMFQKFLSDGARKVCSVLLARDRASEAGSRVLLGTLLNSDTYATAPAAFDSNMRRLIMRFHGRRYASGDPRLEEWRALHADVTELLDGDAHAAWEVVCVGLITHPDFYLY